MNFNLFKTLADAQGPSGHETNVRKIAHGLVKPLVTTVKTDVMGNLICYKKPKTAAKRKVLLCAHLDEIGLIVNHIDANGFLRFALLGSIDPKTLVAQRVWVHTKTKVLMGIIGSKPIHIMTPAELNAAVSFNDLFIDIGLSKEEADKLVSVGDVVTLGREAAQFGDNMITTKSADDRIGIYIILEALKKAKDFKCDLYVAFVVQEEVGLRGSLTAGYQVNPDISLVIDATTAADIPGVQPQSQVTRMGKGIAISGLDGASISHVGMVNFLKDLAKKNKINHQLKYVNRGGTDAGSLQKARQGSAVCTLSMPTRYLHSAVETISQRDVDSAVELVTAFIENCHKMEL